MQPAAPGLVEFSALLRAGHKQDALEFPRDPHTCWQRKPKTLTPGRRGHRVRVRSGQTAFESAIVARSGRYWLLIEPAIRDQAGWQVGDTVHVHVWPQP